MILTMRYGSPISRWCLAVALGAHLKIVEAGQRQLRISHPAKVAKKLDQLANCLDGQKLAKMFDFLKTRITYTA